MHTCILIPYTSLTEIRSIDYFWHVRSMLALFLVLFLFSCNTKKVVKENFRIQEDLVSISNHKIEQITRSVDTTINVFLSPIQGQFPGVDCRDTSGTVDIENVGSFYFSIFQEEIKWQFVPAPVEAEVAIMETIVTAEKKDSTDVITMNESDRFEEKEIQTGVVGWRLALGFAVFVALFYGHYVLPRLSFRRRPW